MSPGRAAALLALAASCGKVEIEDIGAGFALADVTWFAEEETMFVFYEVSAEQGLNASSRVEVTWASDGEEVAWTPLSDLPSVHPHLPVSCGPNTLCGSTSIHVERRPRRIGVRLRYHPDGELALEAEPVVNIVQEGPDWSSRSLIVYGVFDETNQWIQWRARHQFPTLRNQQVEDYGLRRSFVVRDQSYGTATLATSANPYAYGVACPESFDPIDLPEVATLARARFNAGQIPLAAASASTVCASATVTDANGEFVTGAVARKNPEVRPAFPVLRSPVEESTPIRFFLALCEREISPEYEAMQRQRLQLDGVPTTCIDDWRQPTFPQDLAILLRGAVEAERASGKDMVLVIALHQDEVGVAEAVEEALALVVPGERLRSTPRLVGAFVLDSDARGLGLPELSPVTLWCPSTVELGEVPDASGRTCAAAPDIPDLVLGPLTVGTLPILPTRDDYLDFLATYSEAQAGSVTSLTLLAPEFATVADHVPIEDLAVATFLNNEQIDAEPDDAFSWCVGEDPPLFVFRSPLLQDPDNAYFVAKACYYLGLPSEVCGAAGYGLVPLEWLPDWHQALGESSYDLGILWEFPFLVRMQYEVFAAGAVEAFGLSVPFGIASPSESYYGTEMWIQQEFDLSDELTQCTRFCDHPTFDSAGVYHVTSPFETAYAHACYLPAYPKLGDSGFPLDP